MNPGRSGSRCPDARRLDLCEFQPTGSAATLRPIRFVQTEIYKSETDRTKADFAPDAVSVLRETKPAGPLLMPANPSARLPPL